MKNILELLEKSAARFPDKIAFADEKGAETYSELESNAKSIGTALALLNLKSKPIAIIISKSVDVINAMMGIVYSGNIYTVIDSEMPKERVEKIFATLDPAAIVADRDNFDSAQQYGIEVFLIDNLKQTEINSEVLNSIRSYQTENDPLYILYTSGSTGMPKGTVINHKNVLTYSKWAVDEFSIDEKTVFGNQTPFYFSMSVTDIYSTLRSAATLIIIPKIFFSFPIMLTEFLNKNKINTIYWVPSAFGIAANFKLFDTQIPQYLKTVLFAGEVMPVKFLNYWKKYLPKETVFANLFGPTETTDICTFFVADRDFDDDESLPIGKHCENCNVFILREDGKEADINEEGELYVRGPFVAAGYYNNPEKTAEMFVQNPLNNAYPETCYKTGDLVKMNEKGEIIYIGRKDFQIKRMGYRIELGEIEAAATAIDGVKECACVFDKANEKIILFYSASKVKEEEVLAVLKSRLNAYFIPDEIIKTASLPRNANGKTDRKELEKRIK
ncbi:MAG: amino acid adenylation domain-containing protein [Eubacterium sp.]|nr:amino acid adenylation domain-containing protein [Eubacterium sp.]MBR4242076.1 amino acid adenylation domain-containing protein [Eubacterium sp.]